MIWSFCTKVQKSNFLLDFFFHRRGFEGKSPGAYSFIHLPFLSPFIISANTKRFGCERRREPRKNTYVRVNPKAYENSRDRMHT